MSAGPKALSHTDFGGLKGVNQADGTVATDSATKGQLDTAATDAKARANHTGTQVASTISDFDTQVRTSRLDQLAAPTSDVNLNSRKITALLDPTALQDAATKNYVDSQLSAQAQGLVLKGSVRVATTANVSITSAPSAVDGVALSNGDIVLLMGNTTGSENGPRVFTAAGAALNRAANFDVSAEAVLGSFWDVREGTNADTFALLTNDTVITLNTTALTFVVRGAATASTGYTTTCPTTSAGGSWVVTHNLNTRFVLIQVARVGSPYDIVSVRIERTSANTVTVLPDVALAAGEFEIMIAKVA